MASSISYQPPSRQQVVHPPSQETVVVHPPSSPRSSDTTNAVLHPEPRRASVKDAIRRVVHKKSSSFKKPSHRNESICSRLISICCCCFNTDGLKSNVSAFITFLKAMFGVSLLSSPHVLGETGLLLGTLAYIVIIAACTFACYLVLKARNAIVIQNQQQLQEGQQHSTTSLNPYDKDPNNPYQQQQEYNNRQQPGQQQTMKIVTYGNLGKALLGGKASVFIVFLIVTLHIFFGAGMLAAASHQFAEGMDWYRNSHNHDDQQHDDQEEDIDDNGGGGGVEDETDDENDDNVIMNFFHLVITYIQTSSMLHNRFIRACHLFPFVAILLQFRNLRDLFAICATGLMVYLVGCVGSIVYTTILSSSGGIPDAPKDMWDWKFSGVPNFVASTIGAIEGINLALPTANNMTNANADAIPVVSTVVIAYGILTLIIAWVGYIGGVGGGEGTKHGEDSCEQISYCLGSDVVTTIHQVSLGIALLLTLPIILYPSIEMLELWLEERQVQLQTGRTSSNSTIDSGWNGYIISCRSTDDNGYCNGCFDATSSPLRQSLVEEVEQNTNPEQQQSSQELSNQPPTTNTTKTSTVTIHNGDQFEDEYHRHQHVDDMTIGTTTTVNTNITRSTYYWCCLQVTKHWKLRLCHAMAICILAVLQRSFESTFALIKGIGVSIAGFVLPCVFYVMATTTTTTSSATPKTTTPSTILSSAPSSAPNSATTTTTTISTAMKIGLACLVALGIFNIVLVYMSVFTKHNFMPEHVLHQPHEMEAQQQQDN